MANCRVDATPSRVRSVACAAGVQWHAHPDRTTRQDNQHTTRSTLQAKRSDLQG